MNISVVIPTYHALRFLPACLQSLQAQLEADDELIVVDNASLDGAADYLERHMPSVRVLRMRRNLGFAGGTNAGIAAARGDALLLINDDALLEPGGISALRAALQANPQLGAAAGVLTFARQPDLVASAGIIQRRDGVALDAAIGAPRTSLAPQALFGGCGGLVLLRRTMLSEIGLLDAGYESYLEDVDLAWRAQLTGWQTALVPQAWARHVYSATGGQGSPRKRYLLARNRLRALICCWPSALLRECAVPILAYDAMAMAYAAAHRDRATIAGRLAAVRDLPRLRARRRQLQAARSVPLAALSTWLAPAATPWGELRARQRLAELLSNDPAQ